MPIASIVFGVLAFFGYVVFFFDNGQTGWYLWGAGIASIVALFMGAFGRKTKSGKIGLTLGILGIVVLIFFVLWLTPS